MKWYVRFVTSFLVISMLCVQVGASYDKRTVSISNGNILDRAVVLEAENNMVEVIDQLAREEIAPRIQDADIQFLETASNTSVLFSETESDIITDVRLVKSEMNIDIYQATYITRTNLSKSDEDDFGNTKVYLSILYAKVDNANDEFVQYAHIINTKAGSIDIGSTSRVVNMDFGIHCQGSRCSSETSSIGFGVHNQSSGVIKELPADAGYSLYNTDQYYYGIGNAEGSAAYVRYGSSSVSNNINVIYLKLGLDDWMLGF